MAAWTAVPRTWTAAEVLTAAHMNEQLRDFGSAFGAWASYTPTLSQGATVTKTVTYAKYTQVNKTVKAEYCLAVTSAGTGGNSVLVGLPVSVASTAVIVIGSGHCNHSSTNYEGSLYIVSALTAGLICHNSSSSFGANPAVTLANTDTYSGCVAYEAA